MDWMRGKLNRFHGWTWVVAVVMLVTVLGTPAQVTAATRVRMGVDVFTLGSQFHVAVEHGLFQKYGIEPVLQTFAYGVDTIDAVLSGQLDFGCCMDFATMTRIGTGGFRIVGVLAEASKGQPGFHQLAVRSGIKGPQDLRGKRM
ncbi:MAG: ABC transporter substrate-binding protein, partial [Bacillota bacterium]